MNAAAQPGLVDRGWTWVLIVLASAALVLSAYLTGASLMAAGPAGCGAGSGCGEVLASKWSKLGPVPVSALAVAAYAALIGVLLATRRESAFARGLAWTAALVLAGTILASAAWFIFLQLAVVRAICPYCMVDHGIGVVVAVLILALRARRGRPRLTVTLAVVGILPVIAMAMMQAGSRAEVYRLPVPTAGDYDLIDDQGRRIGLLGGELQLDLAHEPVLGPADAPHVVAMLYDHACPHCRHTHHVMRQLREAMGDDLAVVLMPMPLSPGCNPHAPDDPGDRFAESCERTRIALAVFLADPQQYGAFDQWMFDTDTYRTVGETREHAEAVVGAEALGNSLADPRVEQMLARNVQAYGDVGSGRVPVTLAPFAQAIDGRIEDVTGFRSLVDQSEAGREEK